jgi:hypothetical protein
MTYDEWLRIGVVGITVLAAVFIIMQLWLWHKTPDQFDLRDLFTALGKDKKQHLSRAAIGELVALFATTSGYLGTLAVRPQDYEVSTLVYGGLWVVRGGFSTYLRSKQK